MTHQSHGFNNVCKLGFQAKIKIDGCYFGYWEWKTCSRVLFSGVKRITWLIIGALVHFWNTLVLALKFYIKMQTQIRYRSTLILWYDPISNFSQEIRLLIIVNCFESLFQLYFRLLFYALSLVCFSYFTVWVLHIKCNFWSPFSVSIRNDFVFKVKSINRIA
jgi:hypothetical protein